MMRTTSQWKRTLLGVMALVIIFSLLTPARQSVFANTGEDALIDVMVVFDQPAVFEQVSLPSDSEMSTAKIVSQVEAAVKRGQFNTIRQIERSIPVEVQHTFTQILNGAVMTIRARDFDALSLLPGVDMVVPDLIGEIALSESLAPMRIPELAEMQDAQGNKLTGKGITVAILDSGIDYTHPNLGGCFGAGCKVIGGYDYINKDADPMDDYYQGGHGTHVAGIVASDHEIYRGVAPDVKLLAYKVCGATGSCSYNSTIAALEQAVKDGADIANLSIVFGTLPVHDQVFAPVIHAVTNAGLVVVAAAGNEGSARGTVRAPAQYEDAIGVGMVTKSALLTNISSRGPVYGYVLKPDILAVGENVYSAAYEGGFIPHSGTSMSAPHVAGIAALLLQLHPDWTTADIKSALMQTASSVMDEKSVTPPFLYDTGAGLVQADRAANTQILVNPVSVSLAMQTGGSLDDYRELTIRNITDSPLTFFILPPWLDGLMVEFDPPVVTIPAQSTVTVNAHFLGNAGDIISNEENLHGGFILLANPEEGGDPYRIPVGLAVLDEIPATPVIPPLTPTPEQPTPTSTVEPPAPTPTPTPKPTESPVPTTTAVPTKDPVPTSTPQMVNIVYIPLVRHK